MASADAGGISRERESSPCRDKLGLIPDWLASGVRASAWTDLDPTPRSSLAEGVADLDSCAIAACQSCTIRRRLALRRPLAPGCCVVATAYAIAPELGASLIKAPV